MPAERCTILGWTGKGRLSDLQSSLEYVLKDNRLRARVNVAGGSVVVVGPEPIGVAGLLGFMPGVSWIAAGMAGRSLRELVDSAGVLARRYLRRGDGFSVLAEGRGGIVSGDLGGSVTSRMLESVKGARVREDSPKVRFRATFDGRRGVVGVEVKAGVGGVPTGSETATCLVSGGVHSSVVAWMAMLQGFRVRLVHAKTGEESLLAVARLYSELSHRGDPRWLSLEVIEGESASGALGEFAKSGVQLISGFHRLGSTARPRIRGVLAPLDLMPEEWFESEFATLGLKPHEERTPWDEEGRGISKTRRFAGRTADVSDVIDGLR
jgi:hypothetical protein